MPAITPVRVRLASSTARANPKSVIFGVHSSDSPADTAPREANDASPAESSTTAHQSEFNFVDVMIPILNPAGVQEIIDYGLYGWAMSRFTGTWVGLKCMHETVESTAVVDGAARTVWLTAPDRLARWSASPP